MKVDRFLKTIEALSVNDHLCLIYKTKEEQFSAIIPFISIGLERNEKCIYVADDNTIKEVISAMRDGGIDVDSAAKSGALVVVSKKEAYLRHGYFNPDEMISFLKESTDSAKKDGFSALRVTGEMTWMLGGDPGSERYLEYESKLNYFFPENDCLAICQYNYNRFSPEVITNVIHTHPIVIAGNMVCKNFYYIPPDKFFEKEIITFDPDQLLENIISKERAEAALHESEARVQIERDNLLKIIRNIRDGVYIVNASYDIEYINSVIEESIGPLEGLKCYEYFHERTEPCPWCKNAEVFAGNTVRWEWTLEKTGQTFDLCDMPFHNADGHVSKIEFFLDITERKKAAEELKLHEVRLQSMLELNKMTEASEEEIIEFASDEIMKITKSKISFIGLTDEDETAQITFAYSKNVMKECASLEAPPKFLIENGGIWAEAVRQRKAIVVNDYSNTELTKKGYPEGHLALTRLISVPIFEGKHLASVACVANKETDYEESDVSAVTSMLNDMWRLIQRKRTEEEKQNLWDQLLQSQKIESIGRLTDGIAHDFNNILTGILGYGELSLRDLEKGHPLVRKLNIIIDNCKKAANLVKQLLAFSRKQVLQMKVNNINVIVENMAKMLTRVIGEDIKLDLEMKEAVKYVMLDEIQIEQVLMNLAVNARDAMPNGGTLKISTKDVSVDKEYCKTHTEITPGSYVMLSVEDTGIGMSKEVQEKAFEPFFTTKEKGEGSGLGLSTVFGIVKQHNGSISISSEPLKGTLFKIFMPVTKGVAAEVTKDKDVELSHGNETILTIDDDKIIRSVTKELLEGLGYKILEAESGEEAIELCNNADEAIDLIVADVVMSGINGWDTAIEIKKKRPDIKVIFSSGYLDNPIVLNKISGSNMPFINKPYKPQTLALLVREILDKKESLE